MSDNKVNISGEQINYNDNNVLDALKLNPQQKKTGMIKSIIFTIIAIIVFFVPVTINGSILFSERSIKRSKVYWVLLVSG